MWEKGWGRWGTGGENHMEGRGWGSCEGKGVGITWREGGGDHVKGRGWGSCEGKGVGIM